MRKEISSEQLRFSRPRVGWNMYCLRVNLLSAVGVGVMILSVGLLLSAAEGRDPVLDVPAWVLI